VIDRYFAMWNATDAAQRRDLIAQTYTEDANYIDPLMQSQGREGIDAMVAGVQAQFTSHTLRLTSAVDAHHDRVRFTWDLAPNGGAALVKGTDFAVIVGGKLQ
jgi:hypothetical protein